VADENKQLDRIEDLLAQLIRNVAGVRSDMSEFRTEVNERFAAVEHHQQDLAGQVALLNQRMDYQLNRIAKAEEEVHILKEKQ
jgi:hypothetical protein